MIVPDSSFFIEDRTPEESAVTLPEVREELQDSSRYRFDAAVGDGMGLRSPPKEAVHTVKEAAKDTGDASVLSGIDTRLLALAHDEGATLVTDDYAIQNVASHLGIEARGAGKDEIEEERDWRYRCSGCGRVYDEPRRCEVCGAETTRKNPS